jgi:hypothetical protein
MTAMLPLSDLVLASSPRKLLSSVKPYCLFGTGAGSTQTQGVTGKMDGAVSTLPYSTSVKKYHALICERRNTVISSD